MINVKRLFNLLLISLSFLLTGCVGCIGCIIAGPTPTVIEFKYFTIINDYTNWENSNWLNYYISFKYIDTPKVFPNGVTTENDSFNKKYSKPFDIDNVEIPFLYGVCSKYYNPIDEEHIIDDITLKGVTYKFHSLGIYAYNYHELIENMYFYDNTSTILSKYNNGELTIEEINENLEKEPVSFFARLPFDDYETIKDVYLIREITKKEIMENETKFIVSTSIGFRNKVKRTGYVEETLKLPKELFSKKIVNEDSKYRTDGIYITIVGAGIFYSEETNKYIASLNLCENDEKLNEISKNVPEGINPNIYYRWRSSIGLEYKYTNDTEISFFNTIVTSF